MRKFFILLLAGLLVSPQFILANGEETHGQEKEKSAHMQAMYDLKEKIPKEYSIMERTPVFPDEDSLDRGKQLYGQQCSVCHGPEGRGDGPAAKGLDPKPANFRDLEHSSIYGPGEKYWIIGNGSGKTGMPAFAQIRPLDRWHLVNYIHSLQNETTGHGKSRHEH